ncbi:MAG: N-acetyltransferase [Pseudomonadota bacterium]
MSAVEIRETTPDEVAAVLALYPVAFPEEELRPLVAALLEAGPDVLSLAGVDGASVVGHVLFTRCGGGERTGALLGPLGVHPDHQRQGLGTALVRAGLSRLEEAGTAQVFVLGSPGYYGRFGFLPERGVCPPYPLPEAWAEAWQSLLLAERAPLPAGPLPLPDPWMDAALWAP